MIPENTSGQTTRNKSAGGLPFYKFGLDSQVVNLVVLALSLAAAYFMTIQSLKIELAAKAENVVVETLDRKLAGFEVFLREGVVSKREFADFSRDMEQRLDRIEQHLTTESGDMRGTR